MDVLQRPRDIMPADDGGIVQAQASANAFSSSNVRLLPALPHFLPSGPQGTRPLAPPPISIPASSSLPLFSAFPTTPEGLQVPMRTSSISYKGKERAAVPIISGIERFSRRSSLARTPSSEALAGPPSAPLNPLGHTWGLGPSDHARRRERRATICAHSDGDVAAMAKADRRIRMRPHDRNDDWVILPMSVSVDGHDSILRHRQRHEATGYGHALPPGALPAVDPSSAARFQMIAQERYDALGGKDRNPKSPIRVVRVPSRSSSHCCPGSPISSPPKIIKLDLSQLAQLPYTYGTNSESKYTIQSISPFGASRPLVSPAEHRSIDPDYFGVIGLDLSDTDGSPARRPFSRYRELASDGMKVETGADVQRRASLLSTVGGSSATASNDSALSSASTSLSRSAKSSKETDGVDDVDGEARERRRYRANQRKYILVELVETEVGYSEHLRDLVQIYLPQLAALPIVSAQQRAQIARNLHELAQFHEYFSSRLVDVLREESVGCEVDDSTDDSARMDRIARRIGAVFVEEAPGFSIYDDYCSGSASAMNVIRSIQYRTEWTAYEKRCRVVVAAKKPVTLSQLLAENVPTFSTDNLPPVTLSSQPSRLQLRDLLILPIQRVCRYPLVLATLVGRAMSPCERTGHSARERPGVEQALEAMRTIAGHADEANRRSLMAMRTAMIVSRLEDHAVITRAFVGSLGDCILAGTLDVLYHSQAHPITSPAKVRYLGAFLYGGYLLLVKARRSNAYEVRHYLPLELCDMIDVTEGFFPHSIRLRVADHAFDLACSSAREKDVWATALVQAKEASCIPPFYLPCSAASNRSRRMSNADVGVPTPIPIKRHSMGPPDGPSSWPDELASPVTRPAMLSTVVTHRASPLARTGVDRNLSDVFSEECLACKNHELFRTSGTASAVRQRLSLKDNHLRRRQSDVQLDDTAGMRMSLSRTLSTYNGKRISMASSIKRGLSVGSHDGFTALALQSEDDASPRESSWGLSSDSPTAEKVEFCTDPGLLPHRSESDSSTNGPTTIRRKSSFGSIIATVRRPSRTRSVPASPSSSRPMLLQDEKHLPLASTVLGAPIVSQPPVRPSSIFGKTFRSKSFDNTRPESTESSPRSNVSQGLLSQSGSPMAPSSALASSDELSVHEAGERVPRRQKSMRFFGLNRFTRISGGTT